MQIHSGQRIHDHGPLLVPMTPEELRELEQAIDLGDATVRALPRSEGAIPAYEVRAGGHLYVVTREDEQ